MSYVRFNRHQIFDREWMGYHFETLRAVEDYYLEQDGSWFNEVYNMLCGVWDGYLYTDLLESAKQLGLPTHILQRIANTIRFIETNVNK
jgi:hypothetical protein